MLQARGNLGAFMKQQRLSLLKKIKGTRRALYHCACGNFATAYRSNVTTGKTSSCGCYRREDALRKMAANKEAFSGGNERHGQHYTGAWRSWHGMIQRCTNPARHNYEYYGGRGIEVCDRWLSFDLFYEDMGTRPEGLSIERLDNDGNYEPGNCIWADAATQAGNRRAKRCTHSAS